MSGPVLFIVKTTDPNQLDYVNCKAAVGTCPVSQFPFPSDSTGMVQLSLLPVKQVQVVVTVCPFLSPNLAALL